MKNEKTTEEILREIYENNEYMQTLGIELLEIRTGYTKARMKVKKEICNPYGSVHGGCLFSLADIIAVIAGSTYGNFTSTVSGNMNYVSPAMNTEYIYCTAEVVRQGKKISVYNVTLVNDDEEILENGSFTLYTLKEKVA